MRKFLCAVGFIFLISGCLSKLEDETGQTLDAVRESNRLIKETEEKQSWGTAFKTWVDKTSSGGTRAAALHTVIMKAEPDWYTERLWDYLQMKLPLDQPLISANAPNVMMVSDEVPPNYDSLVGVIPKSRAEFEIDEAGMDIAMNLLLIVHPARLKPATQTSMQTLANRVGEVATAIVGARAQDTFFRKGGYYRDAVKLRRREVKLVKDAQNKEDVLKSEYNNVEGLALRKETASKLKEIAYVWKIDSATVALWKTLIEQRLEIPWDAIEPYKKP